MYIERRLMLKQYIDKEEYKRIGDKTTICCLTLYNGFEIIGSSAPLDVKQFNEINGEIIAYNNALEKLDEHIAFIRHNREQYAKTLCTLNVDEALEAIRKRNEREKE